MTEERREKQRASGRRSYHKYRQERLAKIKEITENGLPRWKEGNLRKLYGLSGANFKQMIEECNNTCFICLNAFSDSRKPNVDHCHSTGKVRGLLCSECNTGLGKFKENPEAVRRALKYLEEHLEITE